MAAQLIMIASIAAKKNVNPFSMSEWLVCDYYLCEDGARVNTCRAIPVCAIKYMELDADSGKVEFAVLGKKRYHPEKPRHATRLLKADSILAMDMISNSVDSLTAAIEHADERAQASATAIGTAIEYVADGLDGICATTKKRHKTNYAAFDDE